MPPVPATKRRHLPSPCRRRHRPELIKSEDTPVFGGADLPGAGQSTKDPGTVWWRISFINGIFLPGERSLTRSWEKPAWRPQCIQAAGGTEKTYENHGGDVYAVEGSERGSSRLLTEETAAFMRSRRRRTVSKRTRLRSRERSVLSVWEKM